MRKRFSATVPAYIPALLILSVCIVLLYSNTFEAPFIFDDTINITKNPFVKLKNLSWKPVTLLASQSPNRWRWLPNISFGLNYYFGGLEVFGFHLVNISIHVLTAFFFYLLARLTLELVMAGRFARTTEIALAAAILWAVHPLQTNGVTYIVQRMTSLAALFSLCSLLCYARARLASTTLAKAVLFAGAILTGIMALFSKETSGMLPIMILGYEFFFLRRAHAIERKKLILLAAAATLVFILICVLFLGSDPVARVLAGYGSRDFTLGQRLLTQPRIISHYLSLFVLPLPARLNLAYDFQLSTGLLAPAQTLLAFMGLAGLTLLGFFLYRRARLASFAIFWFLGNLLVESSVIPLELIFEHRMYMPSMFLCLAAVAWFHRLGTGHLNRARIPLAAIAILFSLFTWQRNDVWKNEISIWTDVVNKTPNLARAYINLGLAEEMQGNHLKAEENLRNGLRIDPQDSHAYVTLGRVYERLNRLEEAAAVLKQGLKTERPDAANLHNNLAVVYIRSKDYPAAIKEAELALRSNPYMADAYINLGIAVGSLGNHQEAAGFFLKAIDIAPDNGESYVRLGNAYEHLNRLEDALQVLQNGLAKKQSNRAKTYYFMGRVQRKLGNVDKAIESCRQALALDPNLVGAILTMGIAFEQKGLTKEAFQTYKEAWRRGYDMVATLNSWALTSYRAGQKEKAVQYLQLALKLNPDSQESHKNLGDIYSQ